MSFFGVGANPFASPVGMKVEKATCETLPSEDWALNMEICDLINHSEEGPRDAVKAIRKRLTAQPKNYTVVMYTLTVLETCVKNCGKRFHILVCTKDFVQELVKLIGPKNDPPAAVQEKVLSLIQSWAGAFCHHPDLSGVSQVYADLKHKGVEFPQTTMENSTPIITPQRSAAYTQSNPHPISVSPSRCPPASQYGGGGETPGIVSGTAVLTSEQKAKLHSELDLVEANLKVLSEMLNELTPGKEQPEDLQLLQDLHATCRAMQERVVELVGRVSDDLLTADLLRINDDLNNLFVRYDRHMSKSKAVAYSAGSPIKSPQKLLSEASPKKENVAPSKKEDEAPLIDLEDDVPIQPMAALNIGKRNEDADFDMFAQSRTAAMDAAKASEPTSAIATTDTAQKPSEFDEMEKWLKENQIAINSGSTNSAAHVLEESVSSSEFDRFLAERAAAADNIPNLPESLPTISAATGSSSMQQSQQRSRTLVKEDQNEKQLFSL